MIGDFPRPGSYKLDNNKAQVYELPTAVEILSYNDTMMSYSWEPISHVTYHEGAFCLKIKIGCDTLETTDNESIAAFDYITGRIVKTTPRSCLNYKLVPYFRKDPAAITNSTIGTRDDGWFLGSMLSDGWLSDKYVGYTKMNEHTRNAVKEYFINQLGEVSINEYSNTKEEALATTTKLGSSHKFHVTDKCAREFVTELDMYATEHHVALTKHIGKHKILTYSDEFLWGVLSGILEGDGTITYKIRATTNSFYARIATSSPYLVDDLKALCYRLGLRYGITTIPARHWSQPAYSFCISSVDMYYNLNNLKFKDPNLNALIAIWKTYPPCKDQEDIIPLSCNDVQLLRDIAISMGNTTLKYQLSGIKLWLSRELLLRYVDHIPVDSQLYKRIMDINTLWSKVEILEETGIQPVFDFEIPTTKVFCVNNGIITYDTLNANGVLTNEANEEILKYLESPERFIHTNGSLFARHTDLINLTIFNLSR